MFFVVCFDISDDKIRRKAVKCLKSFGYRVQKSVFECPDLNEEQFLRMKDELDNAIDHECDTVRYYFLCRDCLQKVEFSGIGLEPITEIFYIA